MSNDTSKEKNEETSFEDLMPDPPNPLRGGSAVWCGVAFEELAEAIKFIDLQISVCTPEQQEVWGEFKQQVIKFFHNMKLAGYDKSEIRAELARREAI
ncbi:MAG: hypothetical protein HLX48_01970 [Halomonas sp.]|uniref:hypothetical protein n=1 Tax=Halomonas sp. TaxID=1486246 RepID=UPI0017D89B2E|nr:hypothetical protein [Halomonas sp.]NWN81750.1 hypothetical protein [Halomonas sp.]